MGSIPGIVTIGFFFSTTMSRPALGHIQHTGKAAVTRSRPFTPS